MEDAFLDAEYARVRDTPSDINQHIETLSSLAAECTSIAEFGVRKPTSTFAFVHGLLSSPSPEGTEKKEGKKTLICVDIVPVPLMEPIIAAAGARDVEVTFVQHDSATVDLPSDVDMLFIDTWHVYGHLKRELARHHSSTRKYIVMHDTEVDGEHGESLRMKTDLEEESRQSGYPMSEITCGLKRAIDEFLAANPEWVVRAQYRHNNGLTVLQRVDPESQQALATDMKPLQRRLL